MADTPNTATPATHADAEDSFPDPKLGCVDLGALHREAKEAERSSGRATNRNDDK